MIGYFIRHPTLANLLMIAFLAVGAAMLPGLQRETFPRIEPSQVEISVLYPGARPETVEEAICQRLEDALDAVDDVHEITCEALEGMATATAEMREGAALDRFAADVKTEVEAIDDFPELAEAPIVKQLGRTDFVASVAITGALTRPDLKSLAEEIKRRMQAYGGIPKVAITGFSERQFRIEILDGTLRQYGLSLEEVAATIRRQNVDLPVGTIQARQGEILLRFADERRSVEALRDLVVIASPEGGQVRLSDIARIDDRFEQEEVKYLFDDEPAAFLEITKSAGDDLLVVVERIEAFLAEERQRAPPGVGLTLVQSSADIVLDRLTLLIENGAMGLVLVGLTMWLFFGARYAFWISAGLPVAFVGGIAAMAVLGYSLNMLTMVGLLIVVGILMDDAIVISESIASRREAGAAPMEAALEGVREVAPGVVSSFLTTLCVFGSLAFLKGDIGQVLRVVPVVMIAVLALSLVEAFLILPNHLGHALHAAGGGRGRVQRTVEAGMAWLRDRPVVGLATLAVRARYATLGLAVAALLLAVTAIAGGALKFSAFPDLDGDTLQARILLPQGTPLWRTEEVVADVVAAAERIDAALTPEQPGGQRLVRHTTVKFNVNDDAHETGAHVATVSLDLLSSESRSIDNQHFFARWRAETGRQADVISLKFAEPSLGPAGRAIEIRLSGEDLGELKAASEALKTWLESYRGVVDVLDDLRLGKPEIKIRINEEGLILGLRAQDIADQLRAAFFGSTVDEIQVDAESYEIDARLAGIDRDDVAALDGFVIVTPDGALAPLSSVASIERDRGFARINRIERRRTVTVEGDVDTRFANANEVIADTLARFVPGLAARHPGVTIGLEGQSAETATTQGSMMSGFVLGLVGVYLVLSFQFRSYVEPVIVMILIPFAFIGAVAGHLLMGVDFSMPSMLGFAALSGVVVNDSILLVNRIKLHHRPGATVAETAPEATRARFRAILLTSLTTIAGLFPLLLETSLQAQVLIPLVTSLAFGLLASTVLVLVVVPAFYAVLDDLGVTTLAAERRARAAAGR
ncbi:efflux RND transporter permease subunit, partial [Paralimibaculum aggregatum]|uniref:efflux RND transporter permease subunit n=1 Tax=Paralimibaculum aggregatum TaxID=3036245 RepID=UPI0025570623